MGTTMPPTRYFNAYADKPDHDDEATACSAKFLSNRSLILMRMGTGPAMGNAMDPGLLVLPVQAAAQLAARFRRDMRSMVQPARPASSIARPGGSSTLALKVIADPPLITRMPPLVGKPPG